MKYRWTKLAISCLMVLALVATLGVGCGENGDGDKVEIIIGHISDMTGPAATALVPINYAAKDLAKYYNDNDLIPGATIKIIEYDARYDPAWDIPGWEWVRSRGAKLGLTALPTTAETLKPYAKKDKMPLWALSYSEVLDYPPEWVFLANCPNRGLINPLLKWISENDPNFPTDRPAKIGTAGWNEPYAIGCKNAIEEYAKAHTDKWEWVGGYLAPMGAMIWGTEVARLKGCDYLWPPSTGSGVPTFMNQFRDSGGTATFIGTDAQEAYMSLIVDSVGWDRIDGTLTTSPTRWWTETQSPIVSLARELLQTYHPKEFDEFIHAGIGYIGGFHQIYAFFEIIKKAVEDAEGPGNFTSQAFYDTAMEFSTQWDTYEMWNFTPDKRYTWNYVGIYKWSKADQDIVRLVEPWFSIDVQ
ncbi:MAG: ABC transporter substrate-binding protein [Chloroflexi bacterium]|nr:ABC transporter substrate-binding protein [Chloroflexota bacterium]